MKKRIFLLASILVIIVGFGTGAWAVTYTDTLAYSADLNAAGDWALGSGASLTYVVDDTTNTGYWTYKYTFDVSGTSQNKGLSHIIIELSDGLTANDFISIGGGGASQIEYGILGSEGGSNPGIPETLYGVKLVNLQTRSAV